MKKIALYLIALSFILVGVEHFRNAEFFVKLMPPYLPFHLELVYLSGTFETLFGFGLVFPRFRKRAAFGLILLLIAVFPANIHLAMSTTAQELTGISAEAALFRLPFQLLFLGIVYWASKQTT